MLINNLRKKTGVELTFFVLSIAAFFVSALTAAASCVGEQNYFSGCIRTESVLIAVTSALIVAITMAYENSKLRCLFATGLAVLANLLLRNNSSKIGLNMTSSPEITWSTVALILIVSVLVIVTISKEIKAKKSL